jgi:hypothetical protein
MTDRLAMLHDELTFTDIDGVIASFAQSDYCDRKASVFALYLRDCFTREERQAMKKRLKRCHCCSRHSHYKHQRFKPADAVPESKVRECGCNCRHYFRWFERNDL